MYSNAVPSHPDTATFASEDLSTAVGAVVVFFFVIAISPVISFNE
jgi:hypothetical protein